MLQHPGAAGGGKALGADIVLHRHRNAGQGPRKLSLLNLLLNLFRLVHGPLLIQVDEGVDLRLHFFHPGKAAFHRLHRRGFALFDGCSQLQGC